MHPTPQDDNIRRMTSEQDPGMPPRTARKESQYYVLRERGFELDDVQIIQDSVSNLIADNEIRPNAEWVDFVRITHRYVRGTQERTVRSFNGRLQNSPIRQSNVPSTNFLRSDGRKLCAVSGAHIPGMKVSPIDSDNPQQVMNAKTAQDVLTHWTIEIDLERQILDIIDFVWRSGTAYTNIAIERGNKMVRIGTISFVDSQPSPKLLSPGSDDYDTTMLGIEDEAPNLDQNDHLFADYTYENRAAPDLDYVLTDVEQGVDVPEHNVVLINTDATEVTVPDGTKNTDVAPWLRFDRAYPNGELIEIYGPDAYHISQRRNLNNQNMGELPKVGCEMGYIFENNTQSKTILTRIWVPPMTYNPLEEDHANWWHDHFPEGVVIHILCGYVVRLSRGVIAEDWEVCTPDPFGEVQQDPLVTDIIGGQRIISDVNKLMGQHLMNGVPKNIVDANVVSVDALQSAQNTPFGFIRVNGKGVTDMSRIAHTMTMSSFPKEAPAYAAQTRDDTREIVGLTPPIFGGGASSPTFREAAQKRDAALAQVGLVTKSAIRWTKNTATKAVKKMARFGIKDIQLNNQMIRVHEDLSDAGWTLQAAEGIPMTDVEIRDSLHQVIQEGNVQLIQAMEIFEPQNRSRLMQLMGLRGMYTRGEDDAAYATAVLYELLAGKPEPGPQGIEFAPVQPNPDVENPDFMMDFMKSWIRRPDGGMKFKKKNPTGYKCVMLYVSEYKSIMDQLAAQQQAQGTPQGVAQGPTDGPPPPGPQGPPPPAPDNGGGRPATGPSDLPPGAMVQ